MSNSAFFWLLLNVFSIAMLAFYSMAEMAAVSFNKVRLQYYVSKGEKRAVWLNWLLHNPTRLFGTTLIGVNVATFFGSEFAREFYLSIGVNPDYSPFSQVLLVVILGELAPMFAARRYAEHVAMIAVPLVFASSKILAPFIWIISKITDFCSRFFRASETQSNIFLSQEELQKVLEEHDEDRPPGSETEDFNVVTANIFSLRQKDVRQIMEPIQSLKKVPSNATVAQVINVLRKTEADYVAIYHKDLFNIVGIAHVCDLVRIHENRRVRDYAKPPWFVTQSSTVMQILSQFLRNNEILAIILNKEGHAEGFIRLEDIVEEIFGVTNLNGNHAKQMTYIERTLPGELKVEHFNKQFDISLDKDKELTLSELIIRELGHHPEVGESIYINPFVLTVAETSLRGIKTVNVTTIMK